MLAYFCCTYSFQFKHRPVSKRLKHNFNTALLDIVFTHNDLEYLWLGEDIQMNFCRQKFFAS